jgi:hypothetical protein
MEIGRKSGTVEEKKVEEELRIVESTRVLNIQPLIVRSSPHSPSSSKCEKGKTYNENIFNLCI